MRKIFSLILNPGLIFGSIFAGVLLVAMSWVLLAITKPTMVETYNITACITTIPFIPTVTPVPAIVPSITPNDNQEGGGTKGKVISIGAYVQVVGTGGKGLRIRSSSGLDGEISFLGLESEIFVVKDGPEESDGYLWWELSAPTDAYRSGWAVQDYLEVVQQP